MKAKIEKTVKQSLDWTVTHYSATQGALIIGLVSLVFVVGILTILHFGISCFVKEPIPIVITICAIIYMIGCFLERT